jgi:HK97 family phage portal protein
MSSSNSLVKFPRRSSGFLAPANPAPAEAKLTAMVHPVGGASSALTPTLPMFDFLPPDKLLPEKRLDAAREVGDGLSSSVLMAPLNFIMRTFPEASPIVEKRSRQGKWDEAFPHPLTALLDRPNPYYSGIELWMATVLDLAFGNAYWLKIRNTMGEVVQLWWVPRILLIPRWTFDGKTFITHYDYVAGGLTKPIDPKDVVHFRFGLDPRNIRLGLSPLGSLLRDVLMDDQAADFATAILKNLGVIGVVIAPESPGAGSKDAAKETKEFIQEHFTGERRGRALALGAPTKVNLLQYNMQGFDVSPLRDVSEERVCAALGIPAAVVGFGTGLQQTKVGATMKEMRQLAWTGGIMPLQKIIGKTVDHSLLSETIYDGFQAYEPPPPNRRGTLRMRFNTKEVAALWEDNASKHDRVRKDYVAGVITRAEARQETGRSFTKDDEVFFQPTTGTLTDASGEPISGGDPAGNPGDGSSNADTATDSNSEDT